MNYIREELLRQQALLVILLTGQRLEPLEQTDAPAADPAWDLLAQEDTTTRLTAETWQTMAARRSRRESGDGQRTLLPEEEAAALLTALAASVPEGQNGAWEAALSSPRRSTRAESDGAGVGAATVPTDPARGAAAAPTNPAPGAAGTAGQFPLENGAVRLVTELRQTEERPGADPAAMSLAFQRDARRYDGGFRLY